MKAQGARGELAHSDGLGVEDAAVDDVIRVSLGVGHMACLIGGDDQATAAGAVRADGEGLADLLVKLEIARSFGGAQASREKETAPAGTRGGQLQEVPSANSTHSSTSYTEALVGETLVSTPCCDCLPALEERANAWGLDGRFLFQKPSHVTNGRAREREGLFRVAAITQNDHRED
jgi:hypothetical protein